MWGKKVRIREEEHLEKVEKHWFKVVERKRTQMRTVVGSFVTGDQRESILIVYFSEDDA